MTEKLRPCPFCGGEAKLQLTYNGDKKEWYLDAYRKVENQCISEETMIAELKRRGLM